MKCTLLLATIWALLFVVCTSHQACASAGGTGGGGSRDGKTAAGGSVTRGGVR